MKQAHLLIMSMFLPSALMNAEEQLMRALTISNNRVTVYVNKTLERAYLREPYFAQYAADINLADLDQTIVTIPFVMNIAPLVWYSGKNYTLPAMDEDLFYALETIKQVFRTFYPSHSWSGSIIPETLIKNSVPTNNAIATLTLFSGGVDALYTVLHHDHSKQLLVTVHGSDIPLHDTHLWKQVMEQNKSFAAIHGHITSMVASNFGTFIDAKKTGFLVPHVYNWWAKTSQALTYCGLVAPIAYSHGCCTVLIGASHTASYPFPHGTHPLIDNAITYAGIRVHHDGADKTRSEKLQTIQDRCRQQHTALPLLRVCWGHHKEGGNCCACEKCVRTIMDLIVLRENPTSYGFNITTEQVIRRSKLLLADTRNKTPLTSWCWLCIQRAYEQQVRHGYTYDQELTDWYRWLADQNLESYVHNDGGYYTDQQTGSFTKAWQNALDS